MCASCMVPSQVFMWIFPVSLATKCQSTTEKKKHCRLQRSSCASTILFLFGQSSRWLARGYGHVSSLAPAQRCGERLPTPSICADVCLPRDILKINQCQVCPIDPCSFSQWTPRATLGASLNTFIHGFCSVIIIIRT